MPSGTVTSATNCAPSQMDVAVAGIFVSDGIIAVGGTKIGVLVLGTITGVAVLINVIAVNWAATVWAAAVMAAFEPFKPGSFVGRLQAESMRTTDRITETVRGVFFISLLLWKFSINSTASSHEVYPPLLLEKRTPPKTDGVTGTGPISM